MIMVIENNYNI